MAEVSLFLRNFSNSTGRGVYKLKTELEITSLWHQVSKTETLTIFPWANYKKCTFLIKNCFMINNHPTIYENSKTPHFSKVSFKTCNHFLEISVAVKMSTEWRCFPFQTFFPETLPDKLGVEPRFGQPPLWNIQDCLPLNCRLASQEHRQTAYSDPHTEVNRACWSLGLLLTWSKLAARSKIDRKPFRICTICFSTLNKMFGCHSILVSQNILKGYLSKFVPGTNRILYCRVVFS